MTIAYHAAACWTAARTARRAVPARIPDSRLGRKGGSRRTRRGLVQQTLPLAARFQIVGAILGISLAALVSSVVATEKVEILFDVPAGT